MHVDSFKNILKEFPSAFDCVKFLCREVQTILFSLTKDEKLNLRTSANLNILYNLFIKAFKNAIVGLRVDS